MMHGPIEAYPQPCGRWLLLGYTYPYRGVLRNCGGEYNPVRRTWHIDAEGMASLEKSVCPFDKMVRVRLSVEGGEYTTYASEKDVARGLKWHNGKDAPILCVVEEAEVKR